MTYLRKNNYKKNQKVKKILLGIVATFFLMVGFFFNNFTSNLIHFTLVPVKKTADFIFYPVKNMPIYFSSKTKLAQKNLELEDENKSLKIENLKINLLKEENEDLREALNLKNSRESFIAEVILTPPFSPYDTFVITSAEDFAVGDLVFYKDLLIGEIIKRQADNSIVRLYSSPGQKIPVKINKETVAEAEGQGNFGFKIQVPKDLKISPEDFVYSMTETEAILGLVEDIEFTESNSFQIIRFHYLFNLNKINFVEIRAPKYLNQ